MKVRDLVSCQCPPQSPFPTGCKYLSQWRHITLNASMCLVLSYRPERLLSYQKLYEAHPQYRCQEAWQRWHDIWVQECFAFPLVVKEKSRLLGYFSMAPISNTLVSVVFSAMHEAENADFILRQWQLRFDSDPVIHIFVRMSSTLSTLREWLQTVFSVKIALSWRVTLLFRYHTARSGTTITEIVNTCLL
jgi:hypothetical protein